MKLPPLVATSAPVEGIWTLLRKPMMTGRIGAKPRRRLDEL